MESGLGVTGPQRFLLRVVGLAPGITRAGLATLVARDASDLQHDLDALVAASLLAERQKSSYHLTAHGATVNGVMAGTVERAVSKAVDDASVYERTSFEKMLSRLLKQLAPSVS